MAQLGSCLLCGKGMFEGQDLVWDPRVEKKFHTVCYEEQRLAEKIIHVWPSLNDVDPKTPIVWMPLREPVDG